MPVDVTIEREEDGSVIVWCSDHDPMSRMKGMHGLCLRPGKAYLELKVRLYNRSTDTQTFLWWANVATRVHEKYQSFFPRDAGFVADHAKRAITEFPLSQGTYYGIDYRRRAIEGVPADERPSHFIPDGSYAENDLSWYANIPVPTSYMVVGSKCDFAGGYDHACEAGVVYIADHHIAPGKKQWTWGNQEFGYSWDRSLTDNDGPYIELMAGAYTDNQPDFSFLAPGETKTFSQYWYPIQKIGVPDFATLDAALRMQRKGDRVLVHLITTRELCNALIQVESRSGILASHCESLLAQAPVCVEFIVAQDVEGIAVTLACAGETLLRYAPAEIVPTEKPEVATEPLLPKEILSNDELYLIGVHLEQYRHATRSPEDYWREALRRDPEDSRVNCALGRWCMRKGNFAEAEQLLRASIARATERNPNPYDGEPYYNLGLVLSLQERTSDAYDAFYKATWNAAWRGPAHHRLAEIDCGRSAWTKALDHIERSLRADADNLNARNLKAMILSRIGRDEDARQIVGATRALDPLDIWSRYLGDGQVPKDGQLRLDLSFDLQRAGMLDDARLVLSASSVGTDDGSEAMLLYALGSVCARLGCEEESATAYRRAGAASPKYVFPSRLEEMLVLQKAITVNPQDARARYYLGNLLYDRRQHEEAIQSWEAAMALDPDFATVWRNLGFGYFNVRRDQVKAIRAFATASALAPNDARILYEQDQLLKRTGELPERRLADLKAARRLVEQRDDLIVEYAALCNLTGRPEEALEVLLQRRFQPWEGGEGMVLTQFTQANLLLGQAAMKQGNLAEGLAHFQACLHPPANLGETWHLLANRSQIEYWTGAAFEAMNDHTQAREQWRRAARREGDFVQMELRPVSESTFWSGMALKRLGEADRASQIFQKVLDYSAQLEKKTPKIDYFATSLPAMLLFEEDLEHRQRILALFLHAQACVGLGRIEEAVNHLNMVEEMDHNHPGPSSLRATLTQAVP
jgi:tetratricopeptide (TPR) repeat protein